MKLKKHIATGLILSGLVPFLLSCHLSTAMMTRRTFEQISIGTPVDTVEELAGSPYDIATGENGVSYYRYLERIQTGPNQICQETYLLTVVNGRVVAKEQKRGGKLLTLQGGSY